MYYGDINEDGTMNHEELIEQWEIDSKIDRSRLMLSIYEIPILHSKYLRILQDYKVQVRKQHLKFDKMKNIKTAYYSGVMSKEQLAEYGWDQYPHVKPSKTGMETLLAGDSDLQLIIEKLEYLKILIDTCESILKEIHQLGFLVRTLVDLQKFEAGVN